MCIIALQYDETNKLLTVAANRDEFYERPTAVLHKWEVGEMTLYGGRDLKEGGTWLAVNEFGYFVAITNYRNPALEQLKPRSRGQIATDFLSGKASAKHFAKQLQHEREQYGPFNVLLFDGQQLIHYNNVTNVMTPVENGIHVLCNATLNTQWPKVERLRESFTSVLVQPSNEAFLQILQDEQKASVDDLPNTGVSKELELSLSSVFIRLSDYGTRCSTIVHMSPIEISLHELTYAAGEKASEQSISVSMK